MPRIEIEGINKLSIKQLGLPVDKSMQCSDWSVRPLSYEQVMYAGMDAWILTQLFDSLLLLSDISMKNDMKKTVKSLCKEYTVNIPDPIKNFIVSTAVREDSAKFDALFLSNSIEENDSDIDDINSSNNNNDDNISGSSNNDSEVENIIVTEKVMEKSLPLNAMRMKENNMPPIWEVPQLRHWAHLTQN